MTVGYLAHGFDLLNISDLDLVDQVRERCSTVVAGVLSDELVESLYGRRPVVPCTERMTLVSHIRGIDRVVEQAVVASPAELGLPREALGFVVAGEPRALPGPGILVVSPRRFTASDVVRAALLPVVDEAVA